MKLKLLIPYLILTPLLIFLVACQPQDAQEQPVVKKADAVASVNGKYISKEALATLKTEISQRMRGQKFPEEQLIEELIKRELLVTEARKNKLDESPEFIKNIESYKVSLLSQMAMQDHFKRNEITDAELKVEYDKSSGEGESEYKARHILVKTEDEAKDIIAKLDTGSDFAELAKELSTGPSGPHGGELGWFPAQQMVPAFSAAVMVLENGKYTAEAVETKFGFHVILREESREKTPPSFESVKARLKPMLQRQKMQDYLDQLREQAKIEIIEAEEPKSVAPAEASPATTNPVVDTEKSAEKMPESEDAATAETGLAMPADDTAEISHDHSSAEKANPEHPHKSAMKDPVPAAQ